MERRDFLKLASMTGLAVVAGGSYGEAAKADAPYGGPLWLMLHTGGGWDVTSIMDPKGAGKQNKYPVSAIPMAGNIPYAPLELSPDVTQAVPGFNANKLFFEKYYNDLTVINGIDNSTNSHDAGTRVTWAGNLAEGKPTVAALIAAAYLPTAPMGFITFGGYDTTDGVVGASRLGNLDALKRLAFPYKVDANSDKSALFALEQAQAKITAQRDARYKAMMAQQRLPRVQNAMSKLYTSRLGSNELSKLTQYLPKNVGNGLFGQAQLAIAAYQAGICVSANLSDGGWDTHGNNDASVARNLQGNMGNGAGPMGDGLLGSIDQIMTYAEQQGVRQNLVLVIGSDFGRKANGGNAPGYNAGNGKDHWSITSMMMMGYINGQKISGNRVLGATDDEISAVPVDPTSLQPSPNGIIIKPAHIQKAIRKAAGIDQSKIVANYPVDASEDLPIFTFG
jgi:hypothetical protein